MRRLLLYWLIPLLGGGLALVTLFLMYRDLDFATKLSDTLTLSTFHGCPPDEIEGIIEYLLENLGLHCIVKLNPTLLGPQRLRELLRDQMGYTEQHVPDSAFENDTKWEQAQGIVERLGQKAAGLGLRFVVQCTGLTHGRLGLGRGAAQGEQQGSEEDASHQAPTSTLATCKVSLDLCSR